MEATSRRPVALECAGADQPIVSGMYELGAEPEAEGLVTISELAQRYQITPRALRFYESKKLIEPCRRGATRLYGRQDCRRIETILQGKRLGFTLTEIRAMLARQDEPESPLTMSREKCVEQINLLERQRRDLDQAIAELRRIYTAMFTGG